MIDPPPQGPLVTALAALAVAAAIVSWGSWVHFLRARRSRYRGRHRR